MKKLVYPLLTLALVAVTWIGASRYYSNSQENTNNDSTTVVDSGRVAKVSQAPQPLAERFDVERIYSEYRDSSYAIVVRFSRPLASDANVQSWINVIGARSSDGRGHYFDSQWVLHENLREVYLPYLQPGKEYKITVTAGATDASGKTLNRQVVETLTTGRFPSQIDFTSSGSVLPKKLTDGLPIRSVNVDSVHVDFLRVHNHRLQSFIQRFGRVRSSDIYRIQQFSQYTTRAFSGVFDVENKLDTPVISNLPVQTIEALKKPGLYIAILREPGKYDYSMKSSMFFVSDVGLHLRKYKHNWRVYTRSLANGEPADNVKLTYLGANGTAEWTGQTNQQGVADISLKALKRKNGVFLAHKGEDFSVLALTDPELDLSQFDTGTRAHQPFEIFAYTERDLYRPGETINANFLLRDSDGRITQPMDVYLKVHRPDGKVFVEKVLKPGRLGNYSATWKLADDAPTGKWQVRTSLYGNVNQTLSNLKINVEEFMPERMKLTMQTDTDFVFSDQSIQLDVVGQYLYGAPASENRFKAEAITKFEPNPVKAFKDYFFGDGSEKSVTSHVDLVDTKLDDQGKTKITYRHEKATPNQALKTRIIGKLFETGGRSVNRSAETIIWPKPLMIGVRPDIERYAPVNKPFDISVIAANPKGELKAVKNVNLELIKITPDYHWRFQDGRGWSYETIHHRSPVHEDTISLSDKVAKKVTLPSQQWGRYQIRLTDEKSQALTTFEFQVGWPWQNSSPSNRPDKVNLSWDKPSYKAGELAKLTIVPPRSGFAVVNIESDALLWSTQLAVKDKGAVVEVPVAADWNTHNIFANVTVFRKADLETRATPNRSVGLLHLPLNRDDRTLSVAIEAPELVEPETTVNAKLSLPNAAGKQAFVTLAAVDVGILNITNYQSPDPIKYFFQPRRYGVASLDLYSRVIEGKEGAKARLRYGGDAAPAKGGQPAKAHVQLVSLFSGTVPVNEKGIAQVPLKLPDFNGKLRLMAVAFGEDQFGSNDTEMTVRAPVVAEIGMPRFMAMGDNSLITLDVQNFTGKDQDFDIAIEASKPIKLAGNLQRLKLKDKARGSIKVPVTALNQRGTSDITFVVNGQGHRVERRYKLTVRPVHPGITKIKRYVVGKGDTVELPAAWFSNMLEDTVSARMSVSNVPPLDVSSHVKNLFAYPYGCLEQTTSRAYPHVLINSDTAIQFGMKQLQPEKVRSAMDAAISRLLGMQLSSGGFALWPGSRHEEFWLSSYVTDFLLKAKTAGYSVPNDAINRALSRLHGYVRRGSLAWQSDWLYDRHSANYLSRSYAAYVLAKQNRLTLSELRNLWSQKPGKMSTGLPYAQIAVAAHLLGDNKLAEQAKQLAIETPIEHRYLGYYGTPVRDYALILALLGENGLSGGESLVFKLVEHMQSRSYFSTQERMALLRAALVLPTGSGVATVIEKQGKQYKAVKQTQAGLPFKRVLGSAELANNHAWQFKADAPLYVEVEYGGYLAKAPEATDTPFAIERQLFDIKGDPINGRPLVVGETIIVMLRAKSNENREDAMVIDLLPAGLEIVNTNIGQGFTMDDIEIDGVRVSEALRGNYIKFSGFMDDRYVAAVRLYRYHNTPLVYLAQVVSEGQFGVPAAFVEDMYQPEKRGFGVSDERLIIIAP